MKRVAEKRCRDCLKVKPISQFYVKEKRKYGPHYFSRCKPCYYTYVYEKDKAQGFKWHGHSEKNGPARSAVTNAVARGKLKKPSRCEKCKKKISKRKLHGHHHRGYKNPLDVQWLCEPCHRLAHAA